LNNYYTFFTIGLLPTRKFTNTMASFSTIPFADPVWLTRGSSPYYTDSHRQLQKEVREYVDTYIAPFCEEWEKQGVVPQEVTL
jgi:NAD dependent epimerase/dehydratase family enzyme